MIPLCNDSTVNKLSPVTKIINAVTATTSSNDDVIVEDLEKVMIKILYDVYHGVIEKPFRDLYDNGESKVDIAQLIDGDLPSKIQNRKTFEILEKDGIITTFHDERKYQNVAFKRIFEDQELRNQIKNRLTMLGII